ncbi:TIGR00366 family protein [Rhodoblastus sp.]|uniref:short-chain fatty acid transporter n=1 Tax=Rhodoblastus sp. TaxID=1962975 RepID=UPI0026249AF5|nr:TIGR00366 family protein [Rhodoblastus sp.]
MTTATKAPGEAGHEGALVKIAIGFTAWAERWFPDAFIFVAIAVVVVALGALANGASPVSISLAFGNGFWSLITFTMQMAFVAIGGYVVATSAPAARLIRGLAAWPKSGVSAVGMVAAISTTASLLNWGLSLIFSGLLVLALARRRELRMDYRAAGAAAYLGLGSVWALGLSSSAAQLQANAASLPKSLLPITGVIPFSETIFLWQSMTIAAIIIVVSIVIATWSAPGPETALTAEAMGVDVTPEGAIDEDRPTQPGEWLEHSPILTLLLVLLASGWVIHEFSRQSAMIAISNLNTYNFLFIMVGMLLHWRPARFLDAVKKAVPATSGVLIQFPFYGAIAAILTQPKNGAGLTVSDQIAHAFVSLTTQHVYPLAIGVYSAILGFFVPSGGGKWLLEAPYLMQAANDLRVHLGWAVQVYNAAEALPNLINPFWMLPLLGVLGLRARNLVGFTFLQLLVMLPLVLFLLWAFAYTLDYHPPVTP